IPPSAQPPLARSGKPCDPGGMTERLARRCAARPRATIAAWAVLALAALATAALAMGDLTTQGRQTGTPESLRGYRLIAASFPQREVPTDVVVVRSERHRVGDPRFDA